jgi:hypothetical protein
MPQRKSACRFEHGCPAFLPTAKSVERAKGSATQHSPKQFVQSACRSFRPPSAEGRFWPLVVGAPCFEDSVRTLLS